MQVQLFTVVDYKGASETQLADVSSEGKIVVIDVLNNGLLPSTQFVCMKMKLLPPPRRICNRGCLSVCLLGTLCRNFQMDLHEIFGEDWQWACEQMLKFWWESLSPSGYRDCFLALSLLGDTESG